MSYPAGNEEWAWTWMGFSPPPRCYNDYEPLTGVYALLKNCFGQYYGLGTFDYWKRSELSKLSNENKSKLLSQLVKDNQDVFRGRTYKGFEMIMDNEPFDEFADRDFFFEKMTADECRKRNYPHAERSRSKDGYKCRTCDLFVPKESDEWIRTEGISNYSAITHNMKAKFLRLHLSIPKEIKKADFEIRKIEDDRFSANMQKVNRCMSEIDHLDNKYSDFLN